MRYYHKFAIGGLLIGVFSMTFGITSVFTLDWIKISNNQSAHPITYGLFEQCQKFVNKSMETTLCEKIDTRGFAQYIQISGYTLLVLGLLTSVLCTAFVEKRNIHFIPPVLLFLSIILILIGLVIYLKDIVEIHSHETISQFRIGYSLIFMFVSCFVGIGLLAYFSFTAGYIYRHILSNINIY